MLHLPNDNMEDTKVFITLYDKLEFVEEIQIELLLTVFNYSWLVSVVTKFTQYRLKYMQPNIQNY